MAKPGYNHGHDGDEDDTYHHGFKVLFYPGMSSKGISGEGHGGYPEDSAGDVVRQEFFPVAHGPDTGNKRSKGAHDGDEARENNGCCAILLKEGMGAVDVFLFHQFAAADFQLYNSPSEEPPDGVIGIVSKYGGYDQQSDQHTDMHGGIGLTCRAGAQRTSGEQEGIARQEGHDHQAGLYENDQEKNGIDGLSVVNHHLIEMVIDVKNKINQGINQIHGQVIERSEDRMAGVLMRW